MTKHKHLFMYVVKDSTVHRFDLADVVGFQHSRLLPGQEPYRLVYLFGDSREPLETYGYQGFAEHVIGMWEDFRKKGYFPCDYWTTQSVDPPF